MRANSLRLADLRFQMQFNSCHSSDLIFRNYPETSDLIKIKQDDLNED